MKEIYPLGCRVLVEPVEAETEVGGILIPETSKQASQEAVVRAVGSMMTDNGEFLQIEIFVGDKVLVSKYAGSEITVNKTKMRIVNHSDILATIKE